MSDEVKLNDLDNLIDKFINEVIINENKNEIIFKTKLADYVYSAEGECCSITWIENIEDQEVLFGFKVLKIEKKETVSEYDDWSNTDIMGYDIYTEKGICHIDFRNESNGYYGGWLQLEEIKNVQ